MTGRLRTNAPFAYGLILALTGMADGLWQGAYAWFLSQRMGFTPSQIGVIIGAQFIFQIILEVPSGAWADRGQTRRVLALAYLAFLLYCALYFIAGKWSHAGAAGLAIAIGAEALFGVGSALLSGTLDAWISEREREATNEDETAFNRRLRRVHSISQLWGAVPCALFGTLAFVGATRGFPNLPWLLGGVGYVAALVAILTTIPASKRRSDALADDVLHAIGRQIGRAVAFLQEQPQTFRLFLRSALAFMPFFATQVFWIPFLEKTLFVGRGDSLGDGRWSLPGIPLIASIWGAGEMARSLGGSLFATKDSSSQRTTLVQLTIAMTVYAIAIGGQIAAVLLDWHEVEVFATCYLISRLAEGRVRRDLGVLKDLWILSERATLQSLDSLIKAIVGLIYITMVGSLMQADPLLGYLVIGATSVVAAYQLFSLRTLLGSGQHLASRLASISSADRSLPPTITPRPGPERSQWRHLIARFFRSRSLVYGTLMFGLVSAPAILQNNSTPIWAFLNELAPDGAVVDITAIEEHQDAGSSIRTKWLVTGGSQHAPVGCRTLIEEPSDLFNSNIGGPARARLRVIADQYYLEFAVQRWMPPTPAENRQQRRGRPARGIEIQLPPASVEKTTCFLLASADDLVFQERRVIPTRVHRLSTIAPASTMILPELVVGFVVICLLFGAAAWDARARLQEVVELAPGTVLDRARECTGTHPYEIVNPTEGLPTTSFQEFDAIISKLGASSLVIGGFTDKTNNAVGQPGACHRVDELWFHQYGARALGEYEDQGARLVGWILGRHPSSDGSDSRSHRLTDPGAEVDATQWAVKAPVPGSAHAADAASLLPVESGDGVLYAATGTIRRERREDRARGLWSVGFAVAIYGADKAPRYVPPLERQLLRLLGDLARMQAERARRNAITNDALHWAKSVFDMIRLPVDKLRLSFRATADNPMLADASLTLAGVSSRVLLGKDRIAHRLRSQELDEVRPPLELAEGLRNVAEMFSHSRHGAMAVELVAHGALQMRVAWKSWLVLEGALMELLWNAGKHGSTPATPDVKAVVEVVRDAAGVLFLVKNQLPASGTLRKGAPRGWGLQTTPVRITDAGGKFIALSVDASTGVVSVGFTLPTEYLEDGQ